MSVNWTETKRSATRPPILRTYPVWTIRSCTVKCFRLLATFAIVASGAVAPAQDSKKPAAKGEVTQAMYMVSNLH